MVQKATHDLYDFMRQISAEMSAEYNRIQMRATEDPGTAGDQGEENWADLLRGWLPRTYEVVTKGRIISQDGETSPQIDVLVLNGAYPKKLLNKKLYLAAGVAAAFECKTTLKGCHVAEAVKNCAKIKSLYPKRTGTPYRELHSPLVYGLLAHSHAWKDKNSTPEQNIEQTLYNEDTQHVTHPRLQLDLLCVADLAAWTSSSLTFIGPHRNPNWSKLAPIYGPKGSAVSIYFGHTNSSGFSVGEFNGQFTTRDLMQALVADHIDVPKAPTEIESLNKLLSGPVLHSRFPSISLPGRAASLIARESTLSSEERKELNRLILVAAYPLKCPERGHTMTLDQQFEQFTPIGVLVSYLTQKLAWEHPLLRDLADYYRIVNIAGSGKGYTRMWPSSIYSETIRPRVEAGPLSSDGKLWDEWSIGFQ